MFVSLLSIFFRKLREKEGDIAKLEKEMKKKLEERNEALQGEMAQQKQTLATVLEQKEKEQKQLQMELQSFRQDNQKHLDEAAKSKEQVLSNIAQLMESELQCSICNELFVKATSLGCSHSFCAVCIGQWMRVKKVCPVCRAPVTEKMSSIVLDSYIERMVEELTPDMLQKRRKLVAERKGNIII